eukprot:CAMPEP_0174257336 /NCGR_PEP_ID=MMETSP0439-20130205/6488_1 /TAXON_ID=0 /ORGANISM="Stereomyxa ramosa, Strain Chinc5" /LENGTH=301 /DNA_ID=CAMNT_0015340379 /DNA_START=422 /DNA_END=1327 /DNA_ORIENTATION=+
MTTTDGKWWGGEPLWVANEINGFKSGTFFWPGSDSEIMGKRPTYYKKYDSNVPFEERVDTIFQWLELPDSDRPTFLTLYFEEPDSTGHDYGTYGPEILESLEEMDQLLGTIVDGLEKRKLSDVVDVILVSDHGMTEVSTSRVIVLEDYVDLNEITIIDTSPILSFFPKNESNLQAIIDALNTSPFITVYKKSEIPSQFHYSNNRRITELIGIAELGWSIALTHEQVEQHPNWFEGGSHGYNNSEPDMAAIFIASGRSFKKGYIKEDDNMEAIQVYNLITHILQIEGGPNNGTFDVVKDLLV